MNKMKYIYILSFTFFSYIINAQIETKVRILTENGRSLITIDSLAFKDSLFSSLYFADPLSKQSYSGKAVIYYGALSIDSINIKNGYKDKLCKSYVKVNSDFKLNRIEYFDREDEIIITRSVYEKNKGKATLNFNNSGVKWFYEIKYHKNYYTLRLSPKQKEKCFNKKIKFKKLSVLSKEIDNLKVYELSLSLGIFEDTIH